MSAKIFKSLKILSIDFDFFQDVTRDDLYMYPDGIDLPTEISTLVWQTKYLSYPELEKIKVDDKKIEKMKDIIEFQDEQVPVMVSRSHKDIYGFIVGQNKPFDRLDLVNIDMHHDLFNGNETLDCGNWISFLIEKYPAYKVTWIANKISKDVYGLKGSRFDVITENLDIIKNKKFDVIFLCRSDNWLPLHLDKDFDDFQNILEKKFSNVTKNIDKRNCKYL